MPTGLRREDVFITQFVSAYENYSWADAEVCWPDKDEDGGVDAIAIRKSDGRRLATEPTIIEPFAGDTEDFAFFEKAFLEIEKDQTLAVEGWYVQIFVPVGVLKGQHRKTVRAAFVASVHEWIRRHPRAKAAGQR
jgi:hypothetical protein